MAAQDVRSQIEDIDNAARAGQQLYESFKAEVGNLNGRISTMLDTFCGDARIAYEAQHAEWNRQMGVNCETLRQHAESAQLAANHHRQLEADSSAAYNGTQ